MDSPELKKVKQARKELLNLLEITSGATEHWPVIRKTVLRIFGRDGLEGLFKGNGKEGHNGKSKTN